MSNLILAGSSFLIPGHRAWGNLQQNHTLTFSEYGGWSDVLLNAGERDAVAIILHLDDMVRNNHTNLNHFRQLHATLISILETRLAQGKEPTIVCIASGDHSHIIRDAKTINVHYQAYWELFLGLEKLALAHPSFYLVNLDHHFGRIGTETAFDNRNWYFAHCRFSSTGLNLIANACDIILTRHLSPPSKVLVLDCDNTIWGGVVGEDGLEGLTLGQDGLGQAFVDFQIEAKNLSSQGILLVLASKNNENDVWEAFDKHPCMELKREDIVAWKINWDEKSENIKNLANELDLGLESFVFWDDNPLEREKVRALVPSVNTIEVPSNVLTWPKYLRELDCFAKFTVTNDDLKKTQQYQSRAKFVRDSNAVADTQSYLRSIGLKPSAQKISEVNIGRAAQLCAKTNQFNLRTIRHTALDLQQLQNNDNNLCRLISLEDNYGDHGIVGLFIMRSLNPEVAIIDTFLMSCRVLGRHLEAWMLSEIVKWCKSQGFQWLIGEYLPTKRNLVAQKFFQSHGFKGIDSYPNIKKLLVENNLFIEGDVFVLSTDNPIIPNIDLYI